MTSPSPALLELMSKVLQGDAPYDELVRRISDPGNPNGDSSAADQAAGQMAAGQMNADRFQSVAGATIDLGREQRCGFGEVVFGEGKSTELISRIVATQLAAGQSSLVTRIDSGVAFQVKQSFPNAHHNPVARTLRVSPTAVDHLTGLTSAQAEVTQHACVVSAGSTDVRVAEEAVETLAWMGIPYQRFDDIGVAGPQRLAAVLPQLRTASAVVVVAGMEGALPSVVAGHMASPVFAVPTSVGYGTSLGGLTPLMSMLTSCAANVAVVNIDAGFKGGYMAGLVVHQLIQATS